MKTTLKLTAALVLIGLTSGCAGTMPYYKAPEPVSANQTETDLGACFAAESRDHASRAFDRIGTKEAVIGSAGTVLGGAAGGALFGAAALSPAEEWQIRCGFLDQCMAAKGYTVPARPWMTGPERCRNGTGE
jgi:hypothetical protein